ncbi:MAG: response regulator [Pseudobutyrivibrio sp.]|nr:response regulator [Pseudobutyrivibrio sp.]
MNKVLIVDDERNIRDGIKALIDWESLDCQVVGDCVNGSLAMDFIAKNEVDIVVTDIKMPVMDGLQLSRNLMEDYPDIKVIILTAYSEFEMARAALKNKVFDFIIKNEFIEELPKTITRCVKVIEEDKKFKENQALDKDSQEYFFNVLKGLLVSNSISKEDIEKYQLDKYNYCICACNIKNYEIGNSDRDMLDIFNNILKISLGKCRYTMMPISENLYTIGVCYEKQSGIGMNQIVNYFSNILIMIEEFMRIEVMIGISTQIEDVNDLKLGYSHARDALSKLTGKGCKLKVYDGDVISAEGESIDVNWYSQRITEATYDEKKNEGPIILEDFTNKLLISKLTFEQCRLYMLVIFSSLIHKAVRYQVNTETDFNEYEKQIYNSVKNAGTIQDLTAIGSDVISNLREICLGKKNTRNELVKKVDDCIKAHYKEELTLQFISNCLYMNNSYISRAYKKVTGITVTDAIAIYRVSKAKELLANTHKKIYEVAQEVGFNDAAYFTNVFYKYTHISPSDYRQSQGKILQEKVKPFY